MSDCNEFSLVIASRLHLGNASSPPSVEQIQGWISNLDSMASVIQGAVPVIAVDATPKIDGYDYVAAIRAQIPSCSNIRILPVTPWGKFVLPLNALLLFAKSTLLARQILFVSAEVSASKETIETLCRQASEQDGVLVAGAALPGHRFHMPNTQTEATGTTTHVLTGRTCPWNTLAVWNVKPLSRTGFLTVSDCMPSAGVEECAVIAAQQRLFGLAGGISRAKLVRLPDVSWQEEFEDEERREWHERKMKSKKERAAKQLELLNGLTGTVEHVS